MEERAQRREEVRLKVWGRYALFLLALFLVGYSIYLVRSALTPIAVGWFIAYALSPLIDRMEKRGFSRTRAILLLLTSTLLLVVLFLVLFVPYFVSEVGGLGKNLIAQAGQLLVWLEERVGIVLPESFSETIAQYQEQMQEILPQLAGWVWPYLGGLFGQMGAVVGVLVNGLLIPVFAFYFLQDFHVIKDKVMSYVPHPYRPWTERTFRAIDETLSGFLHGQLIVALIQGVLFAIGLSIMRIQFGGVIGMIAGIGSIVPYVGIAIGIVLSLLMALLALKSWYIFLAILALFFVVNLLESFFLTPRFVGEKVGLSPVAVIIALLLFGELFGMVGLVIAVPLAAVLRILWKDVDLWYRASTLFSQTIPVEVAASDISQMEMALTRVGCACGGEFALKSRTDLVPPRMGAILHLSCKNCGRARQVRFDLYDEPQKPEEGQESVAQQAAQEAVQEAAQESELPGAVPVEPAEIPPPPGDAAPGESRD